MVLKALVQATGPEPIEAMVRGTPTGTYARRSWFLYEWLLGKTSICRLRRADAHGRLAAVKGLALKL